MKINVGCGKMILDGWVNCDVQHNPRAKRPPDIICEAGNIPLDDGCADTVMALHLIEHFYRWEAPEILSEWRRLLMPGGSLILELPDLEKACRNLLKGLTDQWSMWPIYGDWNWQDPYMMHKHGYTPKTIKALLEESGFCKVKFDDPQTHGRRTNRDMRVTAVK